MEFAKIGRSFGLNVMAAAAGLAGTFYITWVFGLAEFAYYTINFAKFALIMLGAELLPNNFTIFRLQEDDRFAEAVPLFYLLFAIAAAAAALLIAAGLVAHASWFMVAFVFASALQIYFNVEAQATGRVDAFFWIPAATNVARVILLVFFGWLGMSVENVLWASIAIGSVIGQAVMISRFPEFFHPAAYRAPFTKMGYLWHARHAYYGYYLNSLLKRARDTFLPLFCDLVLPSKTEIGRLLVFTRANQAVCGQLRVLEAFMVNRAVRDSIRRVRRRIFFVLGPLGQVAVVFVSLALIYRHGIDPMDMVLAALTGLFIYPYIAELFWRNDALAALRPRRVPNSQVSFLAGLVVPPLIAWPLGELGVPVLLFGYVLGQMLSAATYRLFPNVGRSSAGTGEPAR
jgi:hypothetical protein